MIIISVKDQEFALIERSIDKKCLICHDDRVLFRKVNAKSFGSHAVERIRVSGEVLR